MAEPKPVHFEKVAPPGDEAARKRREDHLRRTVAIARATGLPISSAEQVASKEDGSMPPAEAPPLTFDQRTEKAPKGRGTRAETWHLHLSGRGRARGREGGSVNVATAFRRRAVVEPEEVDTLAPLRRRAEEFEARSKALSGRLREIDEREASLSATIDATVRAGSDADAVAAALAAIPRERAALKAQADAVARAEAETRAELAAEEKRLSDLETDARLEELRTVEAAAEEAYTAALVECGVRYEALLLAEDRLLSAFSNAGRPTATASKLRR